MTRKEETLTQTETQLGRQKSHYDDLKRYIPSKKDTNLKGIDGPTKLARTAIATIKREIEQKKSALSVVFLFPKVDLPAHVTNLNAIIEENNAAVTVLNKSVERSDEERKSLQRKACAVFEHEFVIRNWAQIEKLKTLGEDVKTRAGELTVLERSSPSTDARSRVAATFELLLREFFAEKYAFDKTTFVLKRGDYEMIRGPHRTLSDGEKTAIAFCYFIACVHRKVETNSDYRKLFLVFDDPVTSMSYDFVFSIAQTLKNLSISNQGEVLLNPGLIDGAKYVRPDLLVLTHSAYFFNISFTNRMVKDEAAFALHPEKGTHKIVAMKRYVAPFGEQLREVYEISNGTRDADHSTGNTIRSVLEAIGRFCRPECESLSDFIQHLAGKDGISVKSILINSLSHGTYYEETPPPDDLKLACGETLSVVEKYAAGQLEVLKAKY